MNSIKKIAITGPESTGKSTLSQQLADHYKTVWVPEFARSYIDQLDRPYEQKDLKTIAKGQLSLEQEMMHKANGLLICDTELTVINIWSEYKFGDTDPCIVSKCKENPYDLYLLMDIDLPWIFDKQREQPEKRQFFFDWFRREFEFRNLPYQIISGSSHLRFHNACQAIDSFLKISVSDQ